MDLRWVIRVLWERIDRSVVVEMKIGAVVLVVVLVMDGVAMV